VQVEVQILDVHRGGTKGESANCYATGREQVDSHIEMVPPGYAGDDPWELVVGEVTERIRRMGKMQQLAIIREGKKFFDFSNESLRKQIKGKRVRITGWLFWDDDHRLEDFLTDPADNLGSRNWRATSAEIHPITGIEIL
jgi:hypothetical protein